jgi:hypothetical protein
MCREKMVAREIKGEPIDIKEQVTTISTDLQTDLQKK